MTNMQNQAMKIAWSRGSMTPSGKCVGESSLRYSHFLLFSLKKGSWEIPFEIPFGGSKGISTYNH
jgi:hypothetical protein